jgi:hypothetical protein
MAMVVLTYNSYIGYGKCFTTKAAVLDPDPAILVNPDPDSIRIQGFDDKIEEKIQLRIL